MKQFFLCSGFLFAGLVFLGCQGESQGSTSTAPNADVSARELPEQSLYWLDSTWQDQTGQTRTLKDFRGHVTVEAMIFTNCAYACPRLLADLKALEKEVPKRQRADVRWLLISMDSDRDTPEVLQAYAQEQGLDPNRWTLLHGDADAVREVAALTNVRYKQGPKGDFSHSNIINILSRDGEITHQLEGLGVDPTEGARAIHKALQP